MFGQIPDFNDGFEFLRKMWGSATGMPGLQAMTPPMDLDEIDKRIHDLKAVESWLQLNANLTRTTIQGLEVQRATLVALQTFSTALSPEAVQTAMENVARAANAPSASPLRREPVPEPRPEPRPYEATAAERGDDEGDEAERDQGDERAAAEAEPQAGGTSSDDGSASPQEPPPPHANLWWDMLQQQFNQVASTAAAASLASLGNLGGGLGSYGAAAPAANDKSGNKDAVNRTAAAKSPRKPDAGKAGSKSGERATKQPAGKATAKRPAGKTATRTRTAAKKTGTPSGKAADTKTEGARGTRGKSST